MVAAIEFMETENCCPACMRIIPAKETRKRIRKSKSHSSTMLIFGTVFLLLLLAPEFSVARKVVLFDTTAAGSSDTAVVTHSSGSPGWLEESVVTTDEEGKFHQVQGYVACDISYRGNVDNWFRTPFIRPGNGTHRIHIEVRFTMRDCKLYPGEASTCRETFSLYYHEADSPLGDGGRIDWEEKDGAYAKIDRITGDVDRFTERNTNQAPNVETRGIEISKKGVYFAFQDEGGCTSIHQIKIYYFTCNDTVKGLALFKETPANPRFDGGALNPTVGRCVDHAQPVNDVLPNFFCMPNGQWGAFSGGCQCNPGYWADGQRCIACPANTYSRENGEKCKPCPGNSLTAAEGNSFCPCNAGFYRAKDEDNTVGCTQPPTRPTGLEVKEVSQNRAVLEWTHPSKTGGRSKFWYTVKCPDCPSSTQYSPGSERFNTTKLTLTGLRPGSSYVVRIHAENDITEMTMGVSFYDAIEVKTAAYAPLSIENVYEELISETQLLLSWDTPSLSEVVYDAASRQFGQELGDVAGARPMTQENPKVMYAIRKFRKKERYHNDFDTYNTPESSYLFTDLDPKGIYRFQIRAVVNGMDGDWTPIKETNMAILNGKETTTALSNGGGRNTQATTVAFAVLGSLIIVALIIGAIILYRRRREPHCRRKQPSDLDVLEYKTGGNLTPDYHLHQQQQLQLAATLNRKLTAPLMSQMAHSNHAPMHSGYKPYVDPLAYEDPNVALKEFAFELDSNIVHINEIIGAGEFGEVCKGELKFASRQTQTVAIKTLKPGSPIKARSDFLMEASIMGQFDHPNVISLRGVVTKSEPVMIITEYMENGSLDSFLKARDGKLGILNLVSILRGISRGMKYLSDKGYVHRDLAARNVLVDGVLNCKIADFGLSRGMDMEGSTEQVYTTKGGKIPVRWTAPEAISFRKFTTASDVWSYGVLMWEVMSYGERPYWDWSNQQVIEAIDKGYRLPPPVGPDYHCPPAIHGMMLACWDAEKGMRPGFAEVLQRLDEFMHSPELLYDISTTTSSISTPLDVSQSAVSIPSLPSSNPPPAFPPITLDQFLHHIGLVHRFDTLVSRGVTNLQTLAHLTIVDLMSYGLTQTEAQCILESVRRESIRRHLAPPIRTLPRPHRSSGRSTGSNENGDFGTSPMGPGHDKHGYRSVHTLGTNRPSPDVRHQHQNEGFFV